MGSKPKKRRLTVSIDEGIYNSLSTIAEINGQSIASVIRDYLALGEEALALMASSLEAAAALEEDEKARIRERMDRASAAVEGSLQHVLGVQRQVKKELDEVTGGGSPRSVERAPDTPSDDDPDPRVLTGGFRNPRKGGQS